MDGYSLEALEALEALKAAHQREWGDDSAAVYLIDSVSKRCHDTVQDKKTILKLRTDNATLKASYAADVKRLEAEKAALETKLEVQKLRADIASLEAQLSQARVAADTCAVSILNQQNLTDQATAYSAAMLDLERTQEANATTIASLEQSIQQLQQSIELKDKRIFKLLAEADSAKSDKQALVEKLVDVGLL